jgi:hypothetical protein
MNKILHDLSEPSLIHAIEANSREFLLTLRRLGDGEERNEPEMKSDHWGGAPISYHNCIVRGFPHLGYGG